MCAIYPPAPACQGPPGCEGYGSKQHVLQPFQTFSMSSYNLSKSSKLVNFQLVDFIFYSFQQLLLVAVCLWGSNFYHFLTWCSGFWCQPASIQFPQCGFRIQDFGLRIPDIKFEIPNSRFRIQPDSSRERRSLGTRSKHEYQVKCSSCLFGKSES